MMPSTATTTTVQHLVGMNSLSKLTMKPGSQEAERCSLRQRAVMNGNSSESNAHRLSYALPTWLL